MTHPQHAHGAGTIAPKNDNSRGQPAVIGGHGTENSADSAADGAQDQASAAFAKVWERLAEQGFVLARQADGALLICRWCWPPRQCADLEAAERFARDMG